jgi:hypothetical protein
VPTPSEFPKSDLRIEKQRVEATIMLSSGKSLEGNAFVSAFNTTQTGPESVKDVMNDGPGFFPFEVVEGNQVTIRLVNRQHVLFVTLGSDDEMRREPDFDVATRRAVSVVLDNGVRLDGYVAVSRPPGRDRLSDHTRWSEPFWYLDVPPSTLIVNASHVIELTEREHYD